MTTGRSICPGRTTWISCRREIAGVCAGPIAPPTPSCERRSQRWTIRAARSELLGHPRHPGAQPLLEQADLRLVAAGGGGHLGPAGEVRSEERRGGREGRGAAGRETQIGEAESA